MKNDVNTKKNISLHAKSVFDLNKVQLKIKIFLLQNVYLILLFDVCDASKFFDI